GTNGQILQTDASGNLSWVTNSGGTTNWAQGGNSFGQTGTIGTNDNQALAFETNNNTRMFINSGGSVGIATSSPSAVFQVGTDLTFETNWPAINFNADGNSTNRYLTSDSSSRIFQNYTDDSLSFNVGAPGTAGNAITWNTAIAIKNATANVGIGTTAPSGRLHVAGGAIVAGPVAAGAGNSGRLELRELAVNGTNSVSLRAADTMASNYTLTLPAGTGTNGQILQTDASGNLSWVTNSGGTTNWAQGGNSFGQTGTIGTNDNQALAFETNNNTRMTITNAGAVGIGTTAPTSALSVQTATDRYGLTHTNGTVIVGSWIGNTSPIGLSGQFGTWTNHNLGFFTNNQPPGMTLKTNGYVGIGTEDPQQRLHVANYNASSDASIFIQNNSNTSGSNAFLMLYATHAAADSFIRYQGNFQSFYSGVDASDSGKFKIGATAASPGPGVNDLMTIENGGRVGIGTTAPSGILHLVGTTSSNSALVVPVATTAARPTSPVNGMIRYNSNTNKFEGREGGSWKDFIGGSAYTGAGTSWVYTANGIDIGTRDPQWVKINSPDNSNPDEALHVVGNIFLEGDSYMQIYDGGVRNFYGKNSWSTNLGSIATYHFTANNGLVLGINTNSPSYALDVNHVGAAYSAIRVPRDTTTNRPTPVPGLIRYNTTTSKFEAYEGAAWVNMIGGGTSQWTTNAGNIYYNTGSVGIGTNSPVAPLDVRKNGEAFINIQSTSGAGQYTNAGINLTGRSNGTSYPAAIMANSGGEIYMESQGGVYTFANQAGTPGVRFDNGTAIFETASGDANIEITSSAANANASINMRSRLGGATQYGYFTAGWNNAFRISSRAGSYSFANAADSGDVAVIDNTGVTSSAFLYTSDRRLKKDIVGVEGLALILNLQGHRFKWKANDQNEIGLIAQEVEEYAPELVVTDSTGRKSVKYGNLVAPLIESTKELYGLCQASKEQWAQLAEQTAKNTRDIASVKAENEDLKQRVDRLEKLVEKLLEEKSK
ncbi:MAG: tail fiber domain-containing protein, partial [Bdellovibrionaceae bacterium]|nr:tail fiber domain-containing protein [Pseudobdellovibrionaceae bacterium]